MDLLKNAFIDIAFASIKYTIPLSLLSFLIGMLIALLVATARMYAVAPIKIICRIYCAVIRGTPLLIQLFIIFYALPRVGITLDPIPSAILGLSLHVGAYASEIIRASLMSVPHALYEGGLAMGFTRSQNFWHVLVPHASFSAIPPLFNTFIDLIKSTSLASIILVPEMMRKAQEYAIVSSKFLLVYAEAAVIYLMICIALEYLQKYLEEKVKLERDR